MNGPTNLEESAIHFMDQLPAHPDLTDVSKVNMLLNLSSAVSLKRIADALGRLDASLAHWSARR